MGPATINGAVSALRSLFLVTLRRRLFESLTKEQVRLLAFDAENIRLEKDRALYREDTRADCAYVVVRGSVDLYRTIDCERVRLGQATFGTILHEMALLIVQAIRQISAVAEEESEVIRLNRILFRRLLEEYPAAPTRCATKSRWI